MPPDFQIESDIPLPEPDPSEELDNLVISTDDPEDDEDPEVPGKRGRKPRCKSIAAHSWEQINDTEERCRLCYEIFPCRNEEKCGHLDCWEARGKLHPWVVEGVITLVERKPNGKQQKTSSGDPEHRSDQGEQEES